MSVYLSANAAVAEDLLRRLPFTSYSSIVQARTVLGVQLRASMAAPAPYGFSVDAPLPPDQPIEQLAAFVHPWNIAAALINVCVAGQRFGGDALAPQEDLLVYAGEWTPLGQCTCPAVNVPVQEAQPAPVQAAPASQPQAQPAPAAEPQQAPAQAAAQPVAESAATPDPEPQPDPGAAQVGGRAPLPDPSITLERKGQSGRPQKSPFEKKIEERKKVAEPPFWWTHLRVSAPKILVKSPAAAVDDSSDGAGPVQSYMVLLALLRAALKSVPSGTTVGELRKYLADVDDQVEKSPQNEGANQLRKMLVPKQ